MNDAFVHEKEKIDRYVQEGLIYTPKGRMYF